MILTLKQQDTQRPYNGRVWRVRVILVPPLLS